MVKSLIRLIIIFCLIYLWVLNPIPFVSFEYNFKNQNPWIRQSQQIMDIRGGKSDKKDNLIKMRLLKKYFADWNPRVIHQNQQLEFLESGRKKIREGKRARLNEKQILPLLTPQEKDAFDYFNGNDYFNRKGFYKYHQDVRTPPNIFDTRDTFLKKMQNFEVRNKFLNSHAYKQQCLRQAKKSSTHKNQK